MQRNKKNVLSALLLFIMTTFLTTLFLSCQNDLISEPNIKSITNSSSRNVTLTSPTSVTATQGGIKSVTISWKASEGAASYKIYSALTPYEEMELWGETKTKSEDTSITIEEDPGTTRYYSVLAVDYTNETSTLSDKVLGSTMATPIITGIEANEDGSSATVTWWMDNCSEKTYQNIINYEIDCYANESETTALQTLTAKGSETSVTFTGLNSATKYYYQVTAFTQTDQTKFEISDKLDAETAFKLIPNAPQNFKAAQGINKNCVELTFNLPSFTYYKEGAESYSKHPNYFKIYRKPYGSDDSEYETLVSYLGTQTQKSDTETDSIYVFSCSDSSIKELKDSSGNTVVKVDDNTSTEEDISNTNYPNYLADTPIHFYDYTNITRGKQYTYKIQSYVDDSKVAYSSETSSTTTADGWLIAVPSFSVKGAYTKTVDEETNTTTLEGLTISFNASFEDFDSDAYNYVLLQERTPFTISDNEITTETEENSIIFRTNSISNIISKTINFTTEEELKENQGYYKYTLFITSKNISDLQDVSKLQDENNQDVYAYISQNGKITVTNDSSLTPKIENFEVSDGWSNKFILSWDYNENYTYSLTWKDYTYNRSSDTYEEISDSNNSNFIEFNETDLEFDSATTTATYTHSAKSGTIRKYTLSATSVLQIDKPMENYSYTLGIPEPTMNKIDYDSITVTWPEVTKPEKTVKYTVSAKYEDSSINKDITISDEPKQNTDGNYEITIETPNGYDDPSISGLPINFSVTAQIDDTDHSDDSTVGTTTARTLGPALINTVIDKDIKPNFISVKWNEVEGAKGYLINRIRHDENKIPTDSDCYYYDVDKSKIYIDEEEIPTSAAEISYSSNAFTLIDNSIDKNEDATSLAKYEDRQTKIAWGYEYSYTVLPVLQKDDFKFKSSDNSEDLTTITFTDTTQEETLSTSAVTYNKDLTYAHGATTGYGLNVAAEKAVSGEEQVITWVAPYYGNNYAPTILRRLADSEETSWVVYKIYTKGETSYEYNPSDDERYKAYEYAVKYNISDFNVSEDDNFTASISYNKNLSNTLENRYSIKTEQLNKGYLLALKFTASTGNNYSERIVVSPWNYTERAIGPTNAELYITNYNLLSPTVKVASYDVSNFTIPEENFETLSDTTLTSSDYVLSIAPTAITAGTSQTTDGVLKVLRDAKHYYHINLTSENGTAIEGGYYDTTYKNLVYNKYTYRNITDEELVKAAMLNIAYAFYLNAGGKADYSSVSSRLKYGDATSPTGTTFEKGEYYGLFSSYYGKYHASYTLSNYTPSQLTPSGKSTTFLCLTSDTSSDGGIRISGYVDYYTYQFASTEVINVKNADTSDNALSYDATVTFTCTDNTTFTAKITRNGTTSTVVSSTSTESERKKWFPIYLNGDSSPYYSFTSTDYGWWPSEN